MTVFGRELVANRSGLGRHCAAAIEICRSATHALARVARIRGGRARLGELPDYLLRDVGIERTEIRWITRFGRQEDGSA